MRNTSLILAFAILLVSCSKQSETATRESETTKTSGMRIELGQDSMIPVGKCRLVGTVVSVDTTYRSSDAKGPCAQAPCRAVVRVDSILGYGSAFGAPLSVGQEMTMHFMFTLSPTKDFFKDMAVSLPGLKVGARFQADVGNGNSDGMTEAVPSVSTYKVIEK